MDIVARATAKTDSRRAILELLLRNRFCSRTQLAHALGLTRAAVSVAVEYLIEERWITDVGPGVSTGGRPPVVLTLCDDEAAVIGAAMHDLEWTAVATDLHGHVIHRESATASAADPESSIVALRNAVEAVRGAVHGRSIIPVVGVGSPGLVDTEAGVVINAIDLGWENVHFARLAVDALEMEVRVSNRSKVGALAELWSMEERAGRNLVFITIGTGVAAGIVVNGELYRGTNGSAGELGHISVVSDGPVCGCGNRGCLQTLIAEDAILRRARTVQRLDGHTPVGSLEDIARELPHQPALARVRDEVAEYAAIAVGTIINLLNPERIVLAGPVVDHLPGFVDGVRERSVHRSMRHPAAAARIERSTVGPDASAIGAAVLVLQELPELYARGFRIVSPSLLKNA